jgi:eukaryotic-like serine/threonine-protein kinase
MLKKSVNLSSLAAFLIAGLFSWLTFQSVSWVEKLERFSYGWMVRLTAPPGQADPRIVIIDIDEMDVERMGSWPWPRARLAEMIDLLMERGVKVIGINLPLLERENNPGLEEVKSFAVNFQAHPQGAKPENVKAWIEERLQEISTRIDGDGLLVKSVQKAGSVVFSTFTVVPPDQKARPGRFDLLLAASALSRNDFAPFSAGDFEVKNLYLPFPDLAQAALGFGHGIDSLRGSGSGIMNAAFLSYQGSLLPSFPLRIAAAYTDLPTQEITAGEDRIRMKEFDVPLWKGRQLVKFHRQGDRFSTYSFADILQGRVLPTLEGKIALIGFNFKAGRTIATPLWGDVSESQFHAGVLDNLLNRAFVYRPPFLGYGEALSILLLGALCAFLFPRMGDLGRLMGAVGFVALALGAQIFVLARLNIWVQATALAAAITAIYALTTVRQRFVSLQTSRNSEETNRSLGLSFKSQGLLDLALEKFLKLPLDGETKDLIYHVGLEYEKKKLFSNALAAYDHILKDGTFRDLSLRIPKLREMIKSSTLGSHVNLGASIPERTPLEEMKRIGRYDILEVIGKGSMGLVYKALDPKINRLLAIKTIRLSDEFDEDVIHEIKERFFKEAEIAGRLSHPCIVTIHDIGEDQDLTYMAMEYLEGDDLEKFVSKDNPLPLKNVIHVVASVAEALDYAHRADVIHRDIKPANIRLLRSGGIKVTDFGIARAISSSRTRTGVILGTPNYMSPEQIMGQKVDPRSDIFSLGVLFYQLLTGELPFQGENLSGLLYQITQVKPPALKSLDPKIPLACEQIVDKALAKNPDERFKTAGQMSRVLRLLASRIEQRRKRVSGNTGLHAKA